MMGDAGRGRERGRKEGRGPIDKHPHAPDDRRQAALDLGTLVLPVGPPACGPDHMALNRVPPGRRAGRCARVRKENVPIALRRQFQLRRAVIPNLLAHEKLCARQGALGDEAGHQHGNQQAAADSDQPEHLSKGNSGMHAHTCTGQEAVSGSVDRAAQRRHAIERGGPWSYSCNQGQRCHEYDEGSTRLISPHFAVPISGWTRARIGPGGRQRRRRWPFHRRKPVLAARQGGSMPCN